MTLDPVIFLQVEIANLYMKKRSLTLKEFVELDAKHDLLTYIGEGYEPFHLTGNDGILDEIDNYTA